MLRGSFNILTVLIAVGAVAGAAACFIQSKSIPLSAAILVAGLYLSLSPRIIREWERDNSLPAGRIHAGRGPSPPE